MKKIKYEGIGEVVIPRVGMYKPGEVYVVDDMKAKTLLSVTGFSLVAPQETAEKKKKSKR